MIQQPENGRHGQFQIVTHGLIEERYGHEIMVRAVNQLVTRIPEIRLDILGEGEYKMRVERLVAELGLERNVRLLGFVPFDDLLQRLRGSDLGLIAMLRSPYSELIDTNKMYEYMALRVPVAISKLPVIEENFSEDCVRFFTPGSAEDLAQTIFDLYRNPQQRMRLAANAFNSLLKIRWSTTKQRYVDIVTNLKPAAKLV